MLRILYLKDPIPLDKQVDFNLEKDYNVRTVLDRQELETSLKGFTPHVLLCSLESTISPKEVLDILELPKEQPLVIISVINGNLKDVLPLLESTSPHLRERNSKKAKEDEPEELEKQYKTVYQNSLDGILITQPDGTILSANPAACQMLEMTEEEVCRAGRFGLVDSEDPRLAYAISQREKEGKVHAELTFIKKSGVKFPVELTTSVFKDAQGDLKTTMILRDITERKKVEEQLKISHESYKTIFYNSPIPYIIYDQETLEIIDVNQVAIDNYGYTRKEFTGLSIIDLRPPQEVPHLKMHLRNTKNAEKTSRYGKFVHLKKDGAQIKVEVYGYSFSYNNRICRLAACIDITEKEERLNLLKEKHARLTTAQEIAKIGYWELNIASQTLFFSEMMYKIWGIDKTTFFPSLSSIEESIHPEDRSKFLKAQENSIKNGEKHNVEYRILLPNGETKWVHERGRILTWEDGNPQTVERTVQDVTEQKTYFEKLSTSESRYRGIVKSQTNYLIRTDLQGNYTYYNEKFYSDFGWLYRDNGIVGQNSMSSIKEYHHSAVIDLVQRCVLAPGKTFQIEIDKPMKKKSGVRTTLWDFVCLTDAKGEPTEIQCVGIDISARVKAERQLKDSELRYQLITEATSDAIWDWDIDTGNLCWGKSFKSMFGHDPEDFNTIESWAKILHPDDVERVTEDLFAVIEGPKKKWVCEYRLKKKNGEYAYVIDKGSILRDKNNKAYRAVGSLQDITERKKLEDLLDKANTLSRIGSFELDLKNGELYWSPMTRAIHGVKEDYIPEVKTTIDFYKEGKSRNRIKKVLGKAIRKNKAFDEEFEIVTGSGEEIWVRVMGQPEVENGKCIRINGSFQDINKIKHAELEVLKASREKEILLESIGDAFFAVDENWTVTYWNKHAARLLNCPKERILKKNLWEVFSDTAGFASHRNYEATMKDKKKRHFETYCESTSAWHDVTAYPSHKGLSVFFKDITQRKTADVKLRELNKSLRAHTRELVTANKGLEQFSYIVSHNLRSPVANILGLANLLQYSEYPQEVKETFFDEIFSNVDRLDSVITDLNSILQVKEDKKAKKEKIDLNKLISGIEFSIQHLINKEKAEIRCNFQETASITTVKTYLYSIFYNLIINSIKYRKPDIQPVIEINTIRKGEFIIFTFKDNGLGMDLTSKKDQIFNLYKRFHHHIEGKGMGLFMVKTQVEMLGGKITVESQLKQGTTFTIIFKENVSQINQENEAAMSVFDSR